MSISIRFGEHLFIDGTVDPTAIEIFTIRKDEKEVANQLVRDLSPLLEPLRERYHEVRIYLDE